VPMARSQMSHLQQLKGDRLARQAQDIGGRRPPSGRARKLWNEKRPSQKAKPPGGGPADAVGDAGRLECSKLRMRPGR
jgi:hypothetical protein